MKYIIYKTLNLKNGKFYIGQHKIENDEFDGYFGSGLLLRKAFDKYGKENFVRETLEYCTSANVNQREIYWISELSATNKNIGYNISNGGTGGFLREWTEKEKKEISIRMQNFWLVADSNVKQNHSNKISLAKRDKKMTKEGKVIRRNASKEWWDINYNEKLSRKYKYSGGGNPNSKYTYEIYKNGYLIEKTDNIRNFCENNNFPLSYVKFCIRKNGKYKEFDFVRKMKLED